MWKLIINPDSINDRISILFFYISGIWKSNCYIKLYIFPDRILIVFKSDSNQKREDLNKD